MKAASRIKLAATVASVVRASTRPGAPALTERIQAVPRLVRATLDHRYAGTTLGRLGLVAGAVVYVASPVDLVPEALLPVIGAADDAVVITWALKVFFEETDRFIAWEIGQGLHRPSARRGLGWSRFAAPAGTEAASATIPGAPLPHGPARGRATGTTAGAGGGSPHGAGRPAGRGAGHGQGRDSSADARARAWAGGVVDGLRRDRDTTGAAAPSRVVGQMRRVAGRVSASAAPSASAPDAGAAAGSSDGAAASTPGGSRGAGTGSRAGSAPGRRDPLPEGMRQAATDYVLETVRKRLER